MDILKKPYELSLWEDILTFVYEDGTSTEGQVENGHGAVVAQYYKERKICIIGSDTMDTPIRAIQARLNSKINGEIILTFNMCSHYYDEESNSCLFNPFINLLVNERKIKLRHGIVGDKDTKWYDLIIKNVQENSDSKIYNYIAKSQFVNELSKTGFSLVFDSELENNMGNIETLAGRVLEGSDWQLRPSGEVLKQTIEEPLYKIQLDSSIKAVNMENPEEELILQAGDNIYAFYNNIVNKLPFIQFLYAKKYEKDDDYVITNSPNWIIEEVNYNSEGIPTFVRTMSISEDSRGKRLVKKQKTLYDSAIDKYVSVYLDDENKEVYGFTETKYNSPATVRSYISNSSGYTNTAGWKPGGAMKKVGGVETLVFPTLELASVPDMRDLTYEEAFSNETVFASCLKIQFHSTLETVYNSGIIDQRQHINGFTKGEKYVFRAKYGRQGEAGKYAPKTLVESEANLTLVVADYELKDGKYVLGEEYFRGSINSEESDNPIDYKFIIITCKKTLSYSEMLKKTNSLGTFISSSYVNAEPIYIEDIQFFPYVDNNGKPLLPNEISDSKIETIYYYYNPNSNYKNIDEVDFIYKDNQPNPNYKEVYNGSGYEKIRSITASESNRFNLLQELSETFECWIDFDIEHNMETGEILLDDNYRQKKWVSFHEYVGDDNYIGFKYGINLKSIKRTINSDAIVSKIIVKNNSNEFATDGFCSIARASENENGENFILDFNYYIQQGMLGISEITNDLYLEQNGYLGYCTKLKKINVERDTYIEEQSGLLSSIAEYQALFQTYDLSATEAEEQLRDKLAYVKTLTGYSLEYLIENKDNSWWENNQLNATVAVIGQLRSSSEKYRKIANNALENLNNSQKRFDELTRILTSKEKSEAEKRLLLEKEYLNFAFYKKYSRFLQEGSWISEDYIDDNLYYLDAKSTLHTSSRPKVTYDISVLELSQIDEYKNFVFSLGDKTTIEDTEFFGWTWKDGVQTPYKEEIIVTELISVLDSPEQNQIKVQNYKTQFEDLFQRITATTQSIEYSTGQYQKAANVVETDGTINITTLQNSITNNSLILQNAKDQTVIWDESGITTTSIKNPTEIVRIVSGGIFLSDDGGITWNTGITGRGINANYLTAGTISTERINILNGSFPSFRWDSTGISAYEFSLNQQTKEAVNFNYGKFVRFDQYGLYGINNIINFDSTVADEDGMIGEDKIWKNSDFALTWRGFQIKSNKTNGGYISISSNNDFQVFNSEGKEQIKIGLLYQGNDTPATYGLQLRDSDGKLVMENSSDGKVWIRNELKIGEENRNSIFVSIGYLNETKAQSENPEKFYVNYEDIDKNEIHQIINANNRFIVHEDGSMIATDGQFTGIIHATGGTIGGVEIEQIKTIGYEVIIESDSGSIFKNEQGIKILTARLFKGKEEIIDEEKIQYQWYRFEEKLEGKNSKTIEVFASDLNSSSESAVYSCVVSYDAT